MRLGQLSDAQLRAALRDGLVLQTGPFRFRIVSSTDSVFRGLRRMYADFELPGDGFCDFAVRVEPVAGLRRHWRPQVTFYVDEKEPFLPLAADHAYALLEWGMNWCIAGYAHHFLMLHAAVLERNGHAVVMPADPGAGKSTLTAALALTGYRLLSDEIAIIDRDSGLLVPLARPINLKNDSIEIVRRFSDQAVFGDPALDTHKGTVAHLKPPAASVGAVDRPAIPAHIVFPRWQAGATAELKSRPRADAFMHAARHAFNYEVLGPTGFELMADLVERCECHDFCYSAIPDAIATFDHLTR